LQNLAIVVIARKTMDFSEVTGGLGLWKEVKKSPSPLKKKEFCKALSIYQQTSIRNYI
jgi:hypothetical protein